MIKKLFNPCLTLLLTCTLWGKVEVIEISPTNTDDLPGGKEADGIIGDFVLRNSNVEVTIGGSAPNRKPTWVPFGDRMA